MFREFIPGRKLTANRAWHQSSSPDSAHRATTSLAGTVAMRCFILVALMLLGSAAHAAWPRPAAGPSASGDPEVIFTFDDGPHHKHTANVLDTLKEHGVQAIFFWVGRRVSQGSKVDEHLELVQRAVREGHLVANHTMTHPNLCQIDAGAAASEIDDNARIMEEASGLPMILFRTPYGAHCKRLVRMLAQRDLDHMHWDIDPQEWSDHDSKRTAKDIIRKLDRLSTRAIVILHDNHKVTAKTLPKVLAWIEQENARREHDGDKRPIRILSGSDLMLERLQHPVLTWASQESARAAQDMRATLARLLPRGGH